MSDVRDLIIQMGPQFKLALPKHVSAEKFSRVVQTAVMQSPDLLNADRTTLLAAAMRAAQDGLLPDGKEAAFVTFRKNVGTKDQPKWIVAVQYMPMIKGILKQIRNSGELASLSPHVVRQGDEFEYWIDENGEHLKHRPALSGEGDITHAYCVAKMKDGAVYIEVMTRGEVERVRKASRASSGGPWTDWFDEMARKTAMRRLAKRLPSSTDIEGLFGDDDIPQATSEPVNQVQPEPQPEKTVAKKQTRLKAALESAAAPAVETETVEAEKSEVPI